MKINNKISAIALVIKEIVLLRRAAEYSIICEEVLKEQQNVPMPPMLANQLQQQKTLLQQVLSGSAQKGVNVQASPVVNDYIQHAVKMGLFQGGDINKILSGFDQFFIQKNKENMQAQLKAGQGKQGIVAPPTAVTQQTGARASLPGETDFDPKDPFGQKKKAEQIQAQKNLAAQRAKEAQRPQQVASKPGEMSDFEKRLAAKKQKIAGNPQ